MTICSMPLWADGDNTHALHIGLAGGAAYNLTPTECPMQSRVGANGVLALDYAYYKAHAAIDLGFRTGIDFGYRQASYTAEFAQQYSHQDYLGHQMDYTTSGTVDIARHELQLGIPLMFALRSKGVVWNVGVRLQASVYQQGTQDISSPLIRAYYPAYGVTLDNELITGLVTDDMLSTATAPSAFVLECMASTEIGYEYSINEKNAIGIMAYCHVGVWNSLPDASHTPVIQVAPITDRTNPVPAVSVNDAYSSLLTAYTPLQVGVKVYYALGW